MNTKLLIALVVCVLANHAHACLWDNDTLNMERARFPGALELIAGKFARHSDEYYRWRIEDRLARLKNSPQELKLYDDLAVAYDKLGQHDQAIQTILEKEKIQPGLYETFANLGTFYIHAGEWETGVEFIRQAIQINPDAHFGREEYQVQVIEYVISKQVDGQTTYPLSLGDEGYCDVDDFAKFVLSTKDISIFDNEAAKPELRRAARGVMGMMRFGHHDSPILLECLASLLMADDWDDNKQLATRAILKAAAAFEDPSVQAKYRELAKYISDAQVLPTFPHDNDDQTLAIIEAAFQQEMAEAEQWFAQLRRDEINWIQNGIDVDAAYTERYFGITAFKELVPTVRTTDSRELRRTENALAIRRLIRLAVMVLVVAPLTLILMVIAWRNWRHRPRLTSAGS